MARQRELLAATALREQRICGSCANLKSMTNAVGNFASMAKLADALGLGPSAARRGGSNPSARTTRLFGISSAKIRRSQFVTSAVTMGGKVARLRRRKRANAR